MNNLNLYEQPLNERIRSFLRLQKLFHQFSFHKDHNSSWDHSIAVNSLNEILTFTTRSDIKLEALKELERQHIKLERLAQRPNIDQAQLIDLLKKQTETINHLQSSSGQIGQALQTIELLAAVKQKNSVPGCICDFDLPAYQYWITQSESIRRHDLELWFDSFIVLKNAIDLILEVLRQSETHTQEVAENGFFQRSLDSNQTVQLIQIGIEKEKDYYPEISAGKQRFSIRFLTNPDPKLRPEQCQQDVAFNLSMCNI